MRISWNVETDTFGRIIVECNLATGCWVSSIHPSIHSSIYSFIHSFIYSFIHSLIHLSILPSIHKSIYISILPPIRPSIYPSFHSFIHSSIHPPSSILLSIHSSIHPFYLHSPKIHGEGGGQSEGDEKAADKGRALEQTVERDQNSLVLFIYSGCPFLSLISYVTIKKALKCIWNILSAY